LNCRNRCAFAGDESVEIVSRSVFFHNGRIIS
jgi:hypothetical protein